MSKTSLKMLIYMLWGSSWAIKLIIYVLWGQQLGHRL